MIRNQHQSFIPSKALLNDLEIWSHFMTKWNRREIIRSCEYRRLSQLGVYTDASGTGSGGVNLSTGSWFAYTWSAGEQSLDICERELIACLQAAEIWGHMWAHKTVVIETDNMTVVQSSKKRRAKSSDGLSSFYRYLFALELKHKCRIVFKHIPGSRNCLADTLSRGRLAEFRTLWPQAGETGEIAPTLVLDDTHESCLQILRQDVVEDDRWTNSK